MAKIVSAAAASHAPGLVGLFDSAPGASQEVVRNIFGTIKQDLIDAKPDVVIAFANDHLANGRPRLYPDFLIGMAGEHEGPAEWYKEWIGCRDYVTPGNALVAEQMLTGMANRGVRMFGQRENLQFDDNISIPTVWTDLDKLGTTLVPVMHNVTVPPFPEPKECLEIGKKLGQFIREDLPDDMRVGLLGTGGMSHEPGGKRYFFIDEPFDHWFMELLEARDPERLVAEVTMEKLEQAGAGGTAELLSWIVVLGAVGDAPCTNLGYTAYENWKSGVGGVIWDTAVIEGKSE